MSFNLKAIALSAPSQAFLEECFRQFDKQTPVQFARDFLRASDKERMVYHIYLGQKTKEFRRQFKELVSAKYAPSLEED